MKKKNKFLIIVHMMIYLSLLIVVTYAWIPRNWNPKIEYSDISITSQGALVIGIDQNSTTDYIDLNQYHNKKSFVLKQVSSVNGKDFMTANFLPILKGEEPKYEKYSYEPNNDNNRYIEQSFYMKAQLEDQQNKKIYLNKDTTIAFKNNLPQPSVEVAKAIRISIQVDKSNPIILSTRTAAELNNLKAATFDDKGSNVFESYNTNNKALNQAALSTQQVRSIESFYSSSDPSVKNNELFSLDKGENKKITIRIWLEGCDEFCIDEIAGSNLILRLVFE